MVIDIPSITWKIINHSQKLVVNLVQLSGALKEKKHWNIKELSYVLMYVTVSFIAIKVYYE